MISVEPDPRKDVWIAVGYFNAILQVTRSLSENVLEGQINYSLSFDTARSHLAYPLYFSVSADTFTLVARIENTSSEISSATNTGVMKSICRIQLLVLERHSVPQKGLGLTPCLQ